MTTVGDIIAFLQEIGETTNGIPSTFASEQVHGARPDDRAASGELSWLSPKKISVLPERLQSFRGSLVLYPASVGGVDSDNPRAIPCRNPKYAFSRAVQQLLPELMRTEWLSVSSGDDAQRLGIRVGRDARIGPGVVLSRDTVVGDGVEIGPNTCIAHARIGNRVQIGANCTIGQPGFGYERGPDGQLVQFPHVGGVEIGDDAEIGNNTCIDRGSLGDTIVKRGAKIDNLVHVAHNVVIGEDSLVIAHAMLGGSVTIGDKAWIAPSASVLNQLTIGDGAVVGMGAVVIRSVEARTTVAGSPAKVLVPRTG